MFVLGNFIYSTAYVLRYCIDVLNFLIIVRAVFSWVNADPSNAIVRTVEWITEPVLKPFRKIVPVWKTGIDFSPVFAFLFLMFIRSFVVQTLFDISARLR